MTKGIYKALNRAAERTASAVAGTSSVALIALSCSIAQAATIKLAPIVDTAAQGGQVSFDLIANFGATTVLSGAVDLSWNSNVIEFNNFAFDSGMAPPRRDTAFDVVDPQSKFLTSIGFANFSGIVLNTDTIIGVVTFDVVGASGGTDINLIDSEKWAGFFDTSSNALSVEFTGAHASVVAPVPVPAAALLMMSGLIRLRNKRRKLANVV